MAPSWSNGALPFLWRRVGLAYLAYPDHHATEFVVFCCWLVLFLCTWLLFSSFSDTCHAHYTPGVGMESINLCTFCARAVMRIDQFCRVLFLVSPICMYLATFATFNFLIRTIISEFLPAVACPKSSILKHSTEFL